MNQNKKILIAFVFFLLAIFLLIYTMFRGNDTASRENIVSEDERIKVDNFLKKSLKLIKNSKYRRNNKWIVKTISKKKLRIISREYLKDSSCNYLNLGYSYKNDKKGGILARILLEDLGQSLVFHLEKTTENYVIKDIEI